jgi:hypothetical protein
VRRQRTSGEIWGATVELSVENGKDRPVSARLHEGSSIAHVIADLSVLS